MPQSLAKILIHLIFSTKNRERILDDTVRPELHKYLAVILKEFESPAILINSVEDHVHILFSHSKNHALIKIVEAYRAGTMPIIFINQARMLSHRPNGAD